MKLNYWLYSRLFAILFFFSYFLDLEFIVLISTFFFIHLFNGIKNAILDYIHINKLNLFLISLIRICFIYFVINILKILI